MYVSSSPNKPEDEQHPAPLASAGKSPHAFMREAFGVQARMLEHRRSFLSAAANAEDAALRDGRGYAAADVDDYFEALAAEENPPGPRLIQWRR